LKIRFAREGDDNLPVPEYPAVHLRQQKLKERVNRKGEEYDWKIGEKKNSSKGERIPGTLGKKGEERDKGKEMEPHKTRKGAHWPDAGGRGHVGVEETSGN